MDVTHHFPYLLNRQLFACSTRYVRDLHSKLIQAKFNDFLKGEVIR